MLYTMKYKRYPIMTMDLTFTPHGFNVNGITKIYNKELLPFCLKSLNIHDMPYGFKKWYERRLMPADRRGLNDIVVMMGKTNKESITDAYGLLILMSFISYGRNMTDQYWMNPVGKPTEVSVKTENGIEKRLVKGIRLNAGVKDSEINNVFIPKKDSYLHMNFLKNGIAENYALNMEKSDEDIIKQQHVDYNFPDFSTNGKQRKKFLRINGEFYLEKEMLFNSKEDVDSFVRRLELSREQCPECFPQGYIIAKTELTVTYQTLCFTSPETQLVTFHDLCQFDNSMNDKPTYAKVLNACEEFGLDRNEIEEFIATILPYLNNPDDYLDNAGFIIESDSQIIVKKIAWL